MSNLPDCLISMILSYTTKIVDKQTYAINVLRRKIDAEKDYSAMCELDECIRNTQKETYFGNKGQTSRAMMLASTSFWRAVTPENVGHLSGKARVRLVHKYIRALRPHIQRVDKHLANLPWSWAVFGEHNIMLEDALKFQRAFGALERAGVVWVLYASGI